MVLGFAALRRAALSGGLFLYLAASAAFASPEAAAIDDAETAAAVGAAVADPPAPDDTVIDDTVIDETVINDIEIVTPEESTASDTDVDGDAGVEIDAQAIPETDANADGGADANAGAGADEALIETVGERATEPLPVDLGATNGSPQGNDVDEANTVSGLRDDGAILQQETLAPQTTEPEATEPETTEPEIASDDDNSEKAEQAEAPALNLEGRATPAMWRVSDDDSELWLLGTFHILPPELDWRSDPLARAVDAAEKIYFEAEVDAPEAQKKTLELLTTEGFLPDGGSLRAMLSAQDAEKFEEIIAELGLPMGQLDRMRPWQAFLIMSVQHIVAQGFTPGAGVEAVLLKEARLRDRALGFFETAEQQIRLFTSLEPKTELALLELTIREWDEQDASFTALFNAWRDGDVAMIDALMNDAMRRDFPAVYKQLLSDRNEDWAEQIDAIMKGDGKTLVAVGAAHLIGAGSVPALLKDAGYTVERYGLDQ